jgi:hypothetical protein
MPPRPRASLKSRLGRSLLLPYPQRGRPVFGGWYISYLMRTVVTILASHLNTMILSELVMNRIDSSLFFQKPGYKSWVQREKIRSGVRIN